MGQVWEAKILDFRIFFDVFSLSFSERGSESEKIEKKCQQDAEVTFLGLDYGGPPPCWGEKKRGGNESMSASCDWPNVLALGVESALDYDPARPAHLRWAADCNPPGGTTAAPPFWALAIVIE